MLRKTIMGPITLRFCKAKHNEPIDFAPNMKISPKELAKCLSRIRASLFHFHCLHCNGSNFAPPSCRNCFKVHTRMMRRRSFSSLSLPWWIFIYNKARVYPYLIPTGVIMVHFSTYARPCVHPKTSLPRSRFWSVFQESFTQFSLCYKIIGSYF